MDLDGKVALVTGAASGIGHAIAKRCLEAGGRVAIADLNEEGAVEAAKELAGQKTAIGVGMDVSKEDQVNEGVARAVEAFDRMTYSFRTPAFKLYTRSRTSPSPTGRKCWPSTWTAPS